MPSDCDPGAFKACVRGFVAAVAYHFSRQARARVSRDGAVTALEYDGDIMHPWPREFAYKLELMVEAGASAVEIAAVYRRMADDPAGECVVNLLLADPGILIKALRAHGFVHAFDKVLMARSIGPPRAPSEGPVGLHIRAVDTPAIVAQTAGLGEEDASREVVLGDPRLHDFVALRDGVAVATAQLVTTDEGIAYVSRMFTAPEYRRTGCCRALLDAAHAKAHAQGAKHAVLVPSLMARELGIYERLGYRECCPIALLIRERG